MSKINFDSRRKVFDLIFGQNDYVQELCAQIIHDRSRLRFKFRALYDTLLHTRKAFQLDGICLFKYSYGPMVEDASSQHYQRAPVLIARRRPS